MPDRIIADEIEKAVKRLVTEVKLTDADIINRALGTPDGFAILHRIAQEEAKEAVRRLREQHFLPPESGG